MEAFLVAQGLGDVFETSTMKEDKEVAKETSVTALIEKLENLYTKKSLVNRFYMKKRMFTLKIAKGLSIEKHIDEFNQVCDTLATINETLDDEG